MKKFTSKVFLVYVFFVGTAFADGPPKFFTDSMPEHAMAEILKSYGALQGEGSSLDPKTRELIALAVAAQIPCPYCVYAHKNNAIKFGATEAELREAAAVAGYVRMLSAMFQAAEIDLDEFMAEHDEIRAASK